MYKLKYYKYKNKYINIKYKNSQIGGNYTIDEIIYNNIINGNFSESCCGKSVETLVTLLTNHKLDIKQIGLSDNECTKHKYSYDDCIQYYTDTLNQYNDIKLDVSQLVIYSDAESNLDNLFINYQSDINMSRKQFSEHFWNTYDLIHEIYVFSRDVSEHNFIIEKYVTIDYYYYRVFHSWHHLFNLKDWLYYNESDGTTFINDDIKDLINKYGKYKKLNKDELTNFLLNKLIKSNFLSVIIKMPIKSEIL